MLDIESISIPDHFKKKAKKIKAYLYYKHKGFKGHQALKSAGIRAYNTKYQINSIINDKDISIFCEELILNPTKTVVNKDKISKDTILQLCADIISDDKSSDNVKVNALSLQNKILDSGDYSLDSNRPIYIITASRNLSVRVKADV